MAGSGKVKGKKNQGKSDANKSNLISKQHGTSSSNTDAGHKRSEDFDKSKESGNKTVPPIVHRDSNDKNAPSKIDIQMMFDGGIASMQRKSFNSTASSLKGNVTFVANPLVNATNSMRGESSVDFDDLDKLDFLKSLENCPNEMDLEVWLATCSVDAKDYLMSNLIEKVEYLTRQVKQRRDCAKKIIVQTAKRFNDDKIELRNLRLQNNERESLLKQKEELDNFNSMLTEKEKNLRIVNRELDHANQAIKRLEAHNWGTQATNAEQKLCTLESKKALLQAQKREGEILKMSKDTEKKIGELKKQFAEERRRITELEQKLKQLNENYEHAKASPSYGS